MALTNAEKQQRWRDRRNDRARVLDGNPQEISDRILNELGVDQARDIVRALDQRLRNLDDPTPRKVNPKRKAEANALNSNILQFYTTVEPQLQKLAEVGVSDDMKAALMNTLYICGDGFARLAQALDGR